MSKVQIQSSYSPKTFFEFYNTQSCLIFMNLSGKKEPGSRVENPSFNVTMGSFDEVEISKIDTGIYLS